MKDAASGLLTKLEVTTANVALGILEPGHFAAVKKISQPYFRCPHLYDKSLVHFFTSFVDVTFLWSITGSETDRSSPVLSQFFGSLVRDILERGPLAEGLAGGFACVVAVYRASVFSNSLFHFLRTLYSISWNIRYLFSFCLS